MNIIDLKQGSPEWHEYRRHHFNASDAAAMLGMSPYKKREELLAEYATGAKPDVSFSTQKLFDRGHELEAAARPVAEAMVGEELFPIIGESEDWSKVSASFDGLTMDSSIVWEHKSMNTEIRGMLQTHKCPPEFIAVQIQQQMYVSGAKKALFMASDERGHGECWIDRDEKIIAMILEGWKKFETDLSTWKPKDAEAVGREPETLPVLAIKVQGAVLNSNLESFKAGAFRVLDSINKTLTTDQDFADAKATVKWCEEKESELDAAKEAVLQQTLDVNTVLKTVDEVKEKVRRTRLDLDKLIKTDTERRKAEIIFAAAHAYKEHIKAINAELKDGCAIDIPVPDFAAEVKGKRNLAMMKDACNVLLLKAKADADEAARTIRANLKWFDENHADKKLVFSDMFRFVAKPTEDFQNTVKARLSEIDRAEQQKREAEAARLKAAEEAKRAAEAEREAEAKRRAEAEAKAAEAAKEAAAARQKAAEEAKAAAEAAKAQEEELKVLRAAQAKSEEAKTAKAEEIKTVTPALEAIDAYLQQSDVKAKDYAFVRDQLVKYEEFKARESWHQ